MAVDQPSSSKFAKSSSATHRFGMRHATRVALSRRAMLVVAAALMYACMLAQPAHGADWLLGNGINNQRRAVGSPLINAMDVQRLQKMFTINTHGSDVSATPTVAGGNIYFPDWNGFLYSADAHTGAIHWRVDVKPLVGGSSAPWVQSRTSPAVNMRAGVVVIGTMSVIPGPNMTHNPDSSAYVMAFSIADGSLRWKTMVSDNGYAGVTASPAIDSGAVFVGVTSQEEPAAQAMADYVPTFRGAACKLDLRTGRLLWTTYMAPAFNNSNSSTYFPGSAVWGAVPQVDRKRGTVYIATGNSYDAPAAVSACINGNMSLTPPNPEAASHCGQDTEDNRFNSIVALKIHDGHVAWSKHMSYFDVWTVACLGFLYPDGRPGKNCDVPYSPDYDFGMAPMLIPNKRCGGARRDMLILGQKSGLVYAFDASTREILWSTNIGVGSVYGGVIWGMAYDNSGLLFAGNSNAYSLNVTLTNPSPGSPAYTNTSFASALDVCTGNITWQTASPNRQWFFAPPTVSGSGANGVVFFPTLGPTGTVYALRTQDGTVATHFDVGPGAVAGGPSIVDGILYIGAGYKRVNFGGGNVTAWAVPAAMQP